jgi:formate dehydrogenase subunit gamma
VERLAHWTYATFFILALVIGLLMWTPSTSAKLAGSWQMVSHLHAGMGLLMIGLPLVLFLSLSRRQLVRDLRDVRSWDRDDRLWLWRALRGDALRGREMPPQGRFNAGQKANAVIVPTMAVGFLVTGSLLLAGPHVPTRLFSGALALHKVLAVAAVFLFVGHLLLALSTRHGRDSLRAITGGTMSETVARERHQKWWRQQRG